jgi:hypothetical protein
VARDWEDPPGYLTRRNSEGEGILQQLRSNVGHGRLQRSARELQRRDALRRADSSRVEEVLALYEGGGDAGGGAGAAAGRCARQVAASGRGGGTRSGEVTAELVSKSDFEVYTINE